jgi:hypothetical protein
MKRGARWQRWVLLGLIVAAGCAPRPQYPVPEGFAHYAQAQTFKTVSPDGVVYRVRMEENKPYADLSFWKEALKKRMLDAGYLFAKESDIAAGRHPGYLLELTAPLGQEDYTYLIFAKRESLGIPRGALRDFLCYHGDP